MFSRSKAWWETRKLNDDPARRRGGPLNRALLELDGKPAGYALYRVAQDWTAGVSSGKVTIQEVVTPTPEATRELWRWLLDFDWTSQLSADLLPLDHPLFLLLAEPRRMKFQVNDGVWVRILDVRGCVVGAHVQRRRRGRARRARWVHAGDRRALPRDRERASSAPTRRRRSPSTSPRSARVYLGGFTFRQLAESFRVEELVDGAIERADALFATVDRALVRRDLLT